MPYVCVCGTCVFVRACVACVRACVRVCVCVSGKEREETELNRHISPMIKANCHMERREGERCRHWQKTEIKT